MTRRPNALLAALSPGGERNLRDTLRDERSGGILLLVATVAALLWANLSPGTYQAVSSTVVGPAALHLDLTVAHWASDGLLAVFFFVVGLELKREIVVGELRRPATAVLPAVAAVGGMLVPAGIYLAVNLTADGGMPQGWAVPTATDIAFAVGVLALVGRGLPVALRAFLLTLAVVDDLLAIIVIAVAYTDGVAVGLLAASLVTVGAFGLAIARGVRTPWLLVPLAVAAWALLHASGVHATIAGVLLGFAVPARPGSAVPGACVVAGSPDQPDHSLAEVYEHRWRPLSAGVAVPLFALFTAGVVVAPSTLGAALADPVAQGVVLGLVVGKPLGIVLATWLVARFTHARLAPGLGWSDITAVGVLAGIGFTVSLLVGTLAFGEGSATDDHVVVAVLAGSAVAAVLGGGLVARRARVHSARAAQAQREAPGT